MGKANGEPLLIKFGSCPDPRRPSVVVHARREGPDMETLVFIIQHYDKDGQKAYLLLGGREDAMKNFPLDLLRARHAITKEAEVI